MKETDKIHPADKGEEELLHNVRHILQEARAKVIHHVNSTLVRAYWQVGKYIVEYEQQGTDRAGYGKAVINTLSRRLVAEFGNGFTATNLRYMRQFYQCYPKYHTLCDKLSWSQDLIQEVSAVFAESDQVISVCRHPLFIVVRDQDLSVGIPQFGSDDAQRLDNVRFQIFDKQDALPVE